MAGFRPIAISTFFFALTLPMLAAPAAADDYPSRSIRMIIPFPPGGSNDVVGRIIANQLGERLGKQVFVDNRSGAGGVVGSDLAHAVPLTLVAGLGHWLIGSVDWHIVGSLLLGSLPGIYFGCHLAAQISDRILLPVLASMLMLIGLRLIAW